jgi:hypothetical protein
MHLGVKTALAAAAVLVTTGMAGTAASAMPIAGLSIVQDHGTAQAEQVRYVCGRWGCRWVPNRYWGPRPIYRPYRWGPRPFYGARRWRRW